MAEANSKSILIVDDTPTNIDILLEILSEEYDLSVATDGESALESVAESAPDLILLDIMMPGMDGYEVCTRLKADESTRSIPVIFITAMNDIKDELKGFEVGAIDYITKPFSPPIVQSRVDSILQLEEKSQALTILTRKLSKYLSPQVYASIFRGEQDVIIDSKRKKLTIFFSDIVNFTATTDGMESEALTELLNSYLDEMSRIALKHGGTIDKFIGDAILIFFGDPDTKGEQEDALACVSMAIEMRERLKELQEKWYSYGMQDPFQVRTGISTGYCTVGNFGSKNRMDYTIIGTQVNTAARLESSALSGQVVISHETWSLIKDKIRCLKNGMITVKGIHKPIQTYLALDHSAKQSKDSDVLIAAQLMEEAISLELDKTIQDLFVLFDREKADYVVATEKGIPQGVIYKAQLFELFQGDLSRAAYLSQTISSLKIRKSQIVDKDWPIVDIRDIYSKRKDQEFYEPVLVTEEEKLVGEIPAFRLITYFLKTEK
ncbi:MULTISPECIES: adenylate/guanylate cyclase domain-containing protein [unclassified Oceanispirochaeta]|uniref:adenylate/guanylate cyclase domain-containing protein n=1 Tax=unclassified Oceanispirochaeta TaxID=2635722 RepID=UPI000E091332|nr:MULTISPECIES: adenylate/guanylate cyclase domain-containing protein [unclassified Oceanispirochaeta]RDG33765.1 response regulator [Oceanispirochaeta sp. M1]